VVDDFFAAVLDFFFLLRFADFEDLEDFEDFELLLEDFLLDFFFFFEDDELVDLVEESEEGALASVCAIAPAVKQSAAAAATKSFRSCISPSRKFISKLLLFRGPSIKVN